MTIRVNAIGHEKVAKLGEKKRLAKILDLLRPPQATGFVVPTPMRYNEEVVGSNPTMG